MRDAIGHSPSARTASASATVTASAARPDAGWAPSALVQTAAVLAALWLLTAAGAALAAPPSEPRVFEFTAFNRDYTDLASDIAPIELTGITVQLESPASRLTVFTNRLRLTPRAGGSFDAELWLTFGGSGTLLADIRMGNVPSRLEDELVVPRQTRQLKLRARIARDAAGYLVTTEAMPEALSVVIESRLGGNLVTLCRNLGLLLGLPCDSLERSFSEVSVPLPPAGETYLVELDQVGPEGARQLDDYLGVEAPPSSEATPATTPATASGVPASEARPRGLGRLP
jgi:hypothetical protein